MQPRLIWSPVWCHAELQLPKEGSAKHAAKLQGKWSDFLDDYPTAEVINALLIECDHDEVCQTHRLNNPSLPVLQQRIVNVNETKHTAARFLPRSHWRRALTQNDEQV